MLLLLLLLLGVLVVVVVVVLKVVLSALLRMHVGARRREEQLDRLVQKHSAVVDAAAVVAYGGGAAAALEAVFLVSAAVNALRSEDNFAVYMAVVGTALEPHCYHRHRIAQQLQLQLYWKPSVVSELGRCPVTGASGK